MVHVVVVGNIVYRVRLAILLELAEKNDIKMKLKTARKSNTRYSTTLKHDGLREQKKYS